jgi:AAA family ATP:ADP antiporter
MFSHFLNLLLVVKKEELKKFIPMAALIFFILFNYSCIYSLKESLIVSSFGAEAISFIELWIVLPTIFIFTLTYIKISTMIADKEKLFYLICSFFLIFFTIFSFLLYPNLEYIRPDLNFTKKLINDFPHLKWFIVIYGNWPLALFNIFSDLWINVMLMLSFWQYANSITPTEQAKRFYPMFGLIGNLSFIGSGMILRQIAFNNIAIKSISYVTVLIVIVGLICMILFRYLHILSKKENSLFLISTTPSISKRQLSFRGSLKLVFSSKYLWLLAIAVMSYGIIITLSQGLWKAQVVSLYPSTNEYILFMADYQKWIGIVSVVMMLIGSILIRKLSWLTSAIIPPIITLITSSIFFSWVFLDKFLTQFISGHLYLILAVLIGSIHLILIKATKFALFDTTKELAYIPLNEELKDKGKAAVDLLGERIGKSGGALLQSTLFIMIPSASYNQFSLLFLLISVCVGGFWVIAIILLNKQYIAKTQG